MYHYGSPKLQKLRSKKKGVYFKKVKQQKFAIARYSILSCGPHLAPKKYDQAKRKLAECNNNTVSYQTWSLLARQNMTVFASLWHARARRQTFLAFSSRKAQAFSDCCTLEAAESLQLYRFSLLFLVLSISKNLNLFSLFKFVNKIPFLL